MLCRQLTATNSNKTMITYTATLTNGIQIIVAAIGIFGALSNVARVLKPGESIADLRVTM